jgi:hypothetical protein
MASCRLGCGFAASSGETKSRIRGKRGRYSFCLFGSGGKIFSKKSKIRIADGSARDFTEMSRKSTFPAAGGMPERLPVLRPH